MTLFTGAMFYGFAIGIVAAALVAVGLWMAREEGRTIKLPVPNDGPFEPTDFRIIRVCEKCRRYLGNDRSLISGQHLNVLVVNMCPHCAKRRAVDNLNPQTV